MMRPDWNAWRRCSEEFTTKVQLRAGLAVVRALQQKFSMKCDQVFGHGDLQYDRQTFEGVRLSRLARRVCDLEQADDDAIKNISPPKSVAVTAGANEAASIEGKAPSGG